MVSREEWGAVGGRGDVDTKKDKVIIHHTVSASPKTYDTIAKQKAHVRQIEQGHLARGFDGIGYNFIVFLAPGPGRRTRVFEGRGWDRIPAATENHNTGSIAVAVVGNFERDAIGRQGVERLIHLCKRVKERYGVKAIRGHREFNQTACPGKNLYAKLPVVRREAGMNA